MVRKDKKQNPKKADNKSKKVKKTPTKKKSSKKKASKKKKERPQRVKMPEQPPEVRIKNFEEVPYGLTPELAIQEAERCLGCKRPRCVEGCPVDVKIPEFIGLIKDGKFVEAAQKIKETNVLPAICGRVCPQETQCEASCVLARRDRPIAIGYLERFCADYQREQGKKEIPKRAKSNKKKVAVIGSGPSGLTVAGDLIIKGYQVTIFEAFHEGGGVLVYGIPEFRLPKAIVKDEIHYLEELGVTIKYNHVIGQIKTIEELMNKDGFDAVYIAAGAGLPRFLGIPGENLTGIYSANEYLTRVNLMKAYRFPDYDTPIMKGRKVNIIGGGNAAMDCARTALRLGSDTVRLVYRRSKEQMPARAEEVHHAEQEGVEFVFLASPVEYYSDENGQVYKMRCQLYRLGEKDKSGRRRPVPIDGEFKEIESDLVIVSIGTNANPLIPTTTPELETNKWGNIQTDDWGRTSMENVYAGGDIVTGGATVISAMGEGRRAALAIDHDLMGTELPKEE
jgi:glutamate synthase (NADPH/NADH) small chain